MKVRSAARAKSAGERAVERGRCGLHLIAISVRGALRVFYEIKLTSLHTHLAAPLTAERRPLAALESEFSPDSHTSIMARVLAGRTFAGRPRGHLPALVCQSGARVENWRLHIQTAEAVYRPAAAVYRSAAEKGVDESTAVYQVYR